MRSNDGVFMAGRARPEGLSADAPHTSRLAIHGRRLFAALWRKLTTHFGNGYRPERHYMRGPGPKWHERNS
jgi:hypothetical protein